MKSLFLILVVAGLHLAAARKATCVGSNDDGSVIMGITLDQPDASSDITIGGSITGLSPGKHGFHVHMYGDLSGKCSTAGGHFNPFGRQHGPPNACNRHVGDFGNILADDGGTANIAITDKEASLWGDWEYSVFGRAMVVHGGEDDLGLGGDAGSLAHGNAGPRVACCIIGIAAA